MSRAALDLVLGEEASEGSGCLPVDGRMLRAFADGIDRGWFRLRPNPGEGAGPLASVASGGELSRSLLAILAVLGSREEPRTAIFDEVDAGVGGATAVAVARRLESLARGRQVLLVTHLPLIACRASSHFRVEKKERGGRTYARVAALDREGRIGELGADARWRGRFLNRAPACRGIDEGGRADRLRARAAGTASAGWGAAGGSRPAGS